MELYEHQKNALKKMRNGSILCGDVGTGKSRTAIAYYFCNVCGGMLDGLQHGFDDDYVPMKVPLDLYIITTARKRDTFEWDLELAYFLMSTNIENNKYNNRVVIDSWNNIGKYKDVEDSFFIFDEQRVIGSGSWVKSFLTITKSNQWILLSATPGDTWSDYIPVFIANGFYKNRTEFNRRHVIYNRYSKWPQIDRYVDQGVLIYLRNLISVDMPCQKKTIRHSENVMVDYNRVAYKDLIKNRKNETGDPIQNSSEFYYLLRKVVNSDPSRANEVLRLSKQYDRIIVFYNFDYELDILKNIKFDPDVTVSEYNGHKHDPLPKTKKWIYLVNYMAGAEGWNCIDTNAMIFYSQNYSYRILTQAQGRIDRMNTPYTDLYYYHLKSSSSLDIRIARAISYKQDFNEKSMELF